MRIIINTSNLAKGGALQVANSFIRYLLDKPQHTYCLILCQAIAKELVDVSFPSNFSVHELQHSPSNKFHGLSVIRKLKAIEKDFDPDVAFSIFGPSYWTPSCTHMMGYAIPHHIYPESPFFEKIGPADRLRFALLKKVHRFFTRRNGQYYVCETLDAKKRLSKEFRIPEDRINVVSNYYHQVFDQYSLHEKYSFLGEIKEYKLVCISAYYLHKNLDIIKGVLDFAGDKPGFKFVLTIPKDVFEKEFSDYKKHIVNLGPIQIEECPSVYHYSDALFLPTLLECFSASYLEAMKMKLPILTSKLSFAEDICGDAAVYYDPIDSQDILNKIQTIMANKGDLIQNLVTAGTLRLKEFSDAVSRADQYIALSEEIVKQGSIR